MTEAPLWQGTDVSWKSSACFVFVHGREAWRGMVSTRPVRGLVSPFHCRTVAPDERRSSLISWTSACWPWDPLLLLEEEMSTAHMTAVLNHREPPPGAFHARADVPDIDESPLEAHPQPWTVFSIIVGGRVGEGCHRQRSRGCLRGGARAA